MVKEPDQLLKDLNRLTEIKIGSSSIKKALEAINQSDVNVKACARYKKVAEDLKKYIKSSDSSLPNLELEGFLGNFLTIEVVYVLVQTLLAEPVLKTIETLGEEFITKFPSIEDNTLSTSFVYSKSTKTLTVTNTSSKKMWDEEMFAAQNSGTLPLKCTFFKCYTPYQTKSLVRFNLATGSVIFDYEYSFGSKSGKWSTEVI